MKSENCNNISVGGIQSNSLNANTSAIPSQTTISKPSSSTSTQQVQSNLQTGKGVDKLSAMTGKVRNIFKPLMRCSSYIQIHQVLDFE